MNGVQGLIALLAGPLAAGMLGTTLMAHADAVRQSAAQHLDTLRGNAVQTFHLDHEPAQLAPYSEGEVRLYQRADASVRSRAVFEDYQGNVYAQDGASGQLLVLPLRRGHDPFAEPSNDSLHHPAAADMQPLAVYFRLK